MNEPMTLEQLIDCMEYRPASITRAQLHEAVGHLKRLSAELASAQSVIRQASMDTFGYEMGVKEFADSSGYDS